MYKRQLYTKGAIDVLLDRSQYVLTATGPEPLTAEKRQQILDVNLALSNDGLRVLAFAMKELPEERELTLADEDQFTFIGLISMIDPPRPEAIKAVEEAKQGGIRTIMITGDHKVTATAIARQLGIFRDGDLAVTGVELDELTDAGLDERLERISVYARVSPEHKIRIVEAWQRKGKIVSMTGDGVNDAPALKAADIGVAMGITGTEVSKDAASMILADDNFATIVKAVVKMCIRDRYKREEGSAFFRKLYHNSLTDLVNSLYSSKSIDENDLEELRSFLDELEGETKQ